MSELPGESVARGGTKPYYQDDSCTIYLGDCRMVLPTLEASIDVVFADPPYGVGMEYGHAYTDEGGAGYDAWMARIASALREMAPIVLATPGIRNMWAWPKPTWVLCWEKPGSTGRSDLGGFNVWEPVLMYGKKRVYNDSKRLPIMSVARPESGVGNHPCPKPLKLMTWLLSATADPGQTVLDPFMGSGTTLVAAKSLGLHSIGIEVNEAYCEIAAKRLAQEVLAL